MTNYLKTLKKLTTATIHKNDEFKKSIESITPKDYNVLSLFYTLAVIGSGIGIGIASTGLIKNGRKSTIGLLVSVTLVFTALLLLTGYRMHNAWKETKGVKIITKKTETVKIPDLWKILGILDYNKLKYQVDIKPPESYNKSNAYELNASNAYEKFKSVEEICENNGIDIKSYMSDYSGKFGRFILDLNKLKEALKYSDGLQTGEIDYTTETVTKHVTTKLNIAERLLNDFGREGRR